MTRLYDSDEIKINKSLPTFGPSQRYRSGDAVVRILREHQHHTGLIVLSMAANNVEVRPIKEGLRLPCSSKRQRAA
jgi:hypothetical protein